MRILGIFIAALALLIGVRMVILAVRTAFSGKVLTRQGIHSEWQPAPTMNDAWKIAFRDGIMGILLIILGFTLLT